MGCTHSWFGGIATFQATLIAVSLTIFNLFWPAGEVIQTSTFASRAIAAMALIVTGVLSDRTQAVVVALQKRLINGNSPSTHI